MHIDELAGDSTVLAVSYSAGVVSVRFVDGESGEEFTIEVPADRFRSDASSEHGSVHIELVPLQEVLPVHPESGLYMMPADFGSQMTASRRGWNLAVGLPQSDYPLMLRICGYKILLATPIRSKESIEVRREGESQRQGP